MERPSISNSNSRTLNWIRRFWNDFTCKEFVALKIIFFFLIGGMSTMNPYVPVQARSLGISADELGLSEILSPVICIISSTFAGIVADKIGNFKIFLSLTVILSGIAALLFLVIPPGHVIHNIPEELPLSLNCTVNGSNISTEQPFTCDYRNIGEMNIKVQSCKYICSDNVQTRLSGFSQKQLFSFSITENSKQSNDSELTVAGVTNRQTNAESTDKSIMSLQADVNQIESVAENRPTSKLFPEIIQLTADAFCSHNNTFMGHTKLNECWLQCEATINRTTLCVNEKYIEVLNPWLTMIAYISVKVFNGLTVSISVTMFEGISVAIANENKGDLGLQRIYSNLGMIMLSPVAGKLVDLFSEPKSPVDFAPAFYMYCATKFLCVIVLMFINLEFKQPSNRVTQDLKTLVVSPRLSCFFLFSVFTGICLGVIETFFFWLLEDLGADLSIMGLTITAGAAVGIPVLMISTSVINKFGHISILSLSMSFYAIMYIGCSFATNPWILMFFKALDGFTCSLMGVASASYAATLSTPSTVVSLQGIYNGLYRGAGRGCGSFIGGFLVKNIGIRPTFQVMAATSAVIALGYFSVNRFIIRENDRKTDKGTAEIEAGITLKTVESKQGNRSNNIDKYGNSIKKVTEQEANKTEANTAYINIAFEKD